MDLLGGYNSDDSTSQPSSPSHPSDKSHAGHAPVPVLDKMATDPATVRVSKQLPADFFDSSAVRNTQESRSEQSVGPQLPPELQRARQARSAAADPVPVPESANKDLWGKLPAPARAAKRKGPVKLPFTFGKAVLQGADSDDDELYTVKRRKDVHGTALVDFLPKPQRVHQADKGRRRALDGGAKDTGSATDEEELAVLDPEPGAAWELGPGGDEPEDEVIAPQAGVGVADGSAPLAGTYAASSYLQTADRADRAAGYSMYTGVDVDAGPAAHYSHADPGGQGAGDAILHQALAQEQARVARQGKGALSLSGIEFKEINASELTHNDDAQRQAAEGVRGALGMEYALEMRAKAKPYVGSKTARRKHQIGTLFYNAQMRELEILENKATSMKNKSETQAKYGWR